MAVLDFTYNMSIKFSLPVVKHCYTLRCIPLECENQHIEDIKVTVFPENELTFTIPMSRFKEMLGTMNDSALFQKAFSILKKRINKKE